MINIVLSTFRGGIILAFLYALAALFVPQWSEPGSPYEIASAFVRVVGLAVGLLNSIYLIEFASVQKRPWKKKLYAIVQILVLTNFVVISYIYIGPNFSLFDSIVYCIYGVMGCILAYNLDFVEEWRLETILGRIAVQSAVFKFSVNEERPTRILLREFLLEALKMISNCKTKKWDLNVGKFANELELRLEWIEKGKNIVSPNSPFWAYICQEEDSAWELIQTVPSYVRRNEWCYTFLASSEEEAREKSKKIHTLHYS